MTNVKKDDRLKLLNVLTALVFSICIPLLLVFPEQFSNLNKFTESFGVLYFIFNYSKLKSENFNFKSTILNLGVGIPFYTFIQIFNFKIFATFGLFPKLLSLVYLKDVRKLFHKMDGLHPVVSRIAPLSLYVPVLVHILACGWIYIEHSSELVGNDSLFIYGRSIYWTITTLCTVGYGDIAARTLPQMAYANLVMIIGVAFFGYVLSNVASLLARLDGAHESYMSNLDRVETYMRYNNIPSELRIKVREYLRYLWESKRGYDDAEVLEQLPLKLKSDLVLHINKPLIEKVPLLNGAEESLLKDLVLQMNSKVYTPGDFIFNAGDFGDEMFLIQKGSVEIISMDGQVLVTLSSGSVFGELALLTDSPRNASAKAVDYCDVFTIDRNTFQQTLSKYPNFEKQVYNIAQKRTQKSLKKIS